VLSSGQIFPNCIQKKCHLQREIISAQKKAMARLSKIQEQARLQILELESLNLLPEAASQRILAALQRAIPADDRVMFGVDPISLLFDRLLCASGDVKELMMWLQGIYLAREPLAETSFPGLMQANLPTVAIHDFPHTCLGVPVPVLALKTPKEWHHGYHDIQTPVGGILRACFAARGRWIAALEMTRRESKRSFRPAEVSFVRLLAPAIGRIIQAAYERERAVTTTAIGADSSGILVLDANRQEQFCNPAAEEWLRQIGDRDARKEGKFPTAVLAAIARLNADLGNPSRALTFWTPAGNLRIEASRSAKDGSTAIVFAPERPPIPPDLPLHWQLTSQEREVVGLVFKGLNNSQMATTLMVSEHTVESHLSHVYEKLDVHSRTELLACFFRDIYWGQIQPLSMTKHDGSMPI
jgi:DNA-binding CsgD family transcriptional regulator